MPNERVCANSETVSAHIRPVSYQENRKVGGKALCREGVLASDMEKIAGLRDHQARYLASLPTQPRDAIEASFEILNPGFDNYIEGFEEALHLSQALAALIEKGDLGEDDWELDAAKFVSQRVTDHLHRMQNQLDHLSYVLSNPKRVEREDKPIA